MQCTKCGAELQPGATVCPSCEARVVLDKKAVAAPRKRLFGAKPSVILDPTPTPKRVTARVEKPRPEPALRSAVVGGDFGAGRAPVWLRPLIIVVAVIVVAAGAWFAYSLVSSGPNTPDAAAVRFMQALAVYDVKGIRSNSTFASLSATDQAGFERQAPVEIAARKGQPQYKEIKVTSVDIKEDGNTAVVRLSTLMLDAASLEVTATPAASFTYSPRDEVLTVVKSAEGKWLVKWN